MRSPVLPSTEIHWFIYIQHLPRACSGSFIQLPSREGDGNGCTLSSPPNTRLIRIYWAVNLICVDVLTFQFTTDIKTLKFSNFKAHRQQTSSVHKSECRSQTGHHCQVSFYKEYAAVIWLGRGSYPTLLVLRAMNFFPKTVLYSAEQLLWCPVETVNEELWALPLFLILYAL